MTIDAKPRRFGQTARSIAARRDRTFLWLSVLSLLIATLGFFPTYWAQIPSGTTNARPLIHLHALVFTAWPVLLVVQTILIERGRIRNHRAWGIAGVSLATTMLLVGLTTAVTVMESRLANGEGDAARAFLIVPFTGVSVFYLFVMAATLNNTRPGWHKRFIIVATSSVLQAAMARFFFFARHGMAPGMRPTSFPSIPVSAPLAGSLLLDLMVLCGMIVDWRQDGRPHPAWLWGLGGLLTVQLLRGPISATPGWLSFADWLTRFI